MGNRREMTLPAGAKPLRLWPAVAVVALQWAAWFGLPLVLPGGTLYGMLTGLACGLVVVVWWLAFSRAPWGDRLVALLAIAVGLTAVRPLLDPSIATAGQGILFWILSIPVICLGLVASVSIGRNLASLPRRAAIAAGIVLACLSFALLRTAGITGDGQSQFAWRWSETPEERLLTHEEAPAMPEAPPVAAADSAPASSDVAGEEISGTEVPSEALTEASPEEDEPPTDTPLLAAVPPAWPGFRGPNRDDVVHGVRIATDWSVAAPALLWRREVGPGWSSFAVGDGVAYTQEQRGEEEVVGAYEVLSGRPLWRHTDPVRFWESNGGAGPRGTPTLDRGRLYALGATGILKALDASNGALVWSRNVSTDAEVPIPGWGFASSPLVLDELVIVAAAGRPVAYDRSTGAVRWLGENGHGGYSSPQLVTLDGVEQIVLLSGSGASGFLPADGSLLWHDDWPGAPIVQPATVGERDLLFATGGSAGGLGTRRLTIARGADGWTATERWTSIRLKPYFNDYVVHRGHAYGFDGSILTCVDLESGDRVWKGGRYGNGQLLLLPDQDLLLVVSEEGELALVSATTDGYAEIARMPAIEGKTWNHPVLVDDVLLVRNGQEMAAFRLALAGN